ncbi:MAG TPA: ABC transporter permease [Bacteroidales bacterium]|jgi:ABC-2 type transport system permease protein|nr:ABC transporter permease [Bacteroidales bacterium]HOU97900.1 ABC transporter permease [Bacteroidales bacterium]
MKELNAFIKKEFIHIFRDWRTLLVLFAIPAIQLIVFGYAISNDLKYISVGVWDKSNDEMSRKMIAKLAFSDFFKVNAVLSNESEIESLFKKGTIKEVIIVEDKFSKKLIRDGIANVQVIADATEPNTANMAVNYTTAMINAFAQEINKQPLKPSPFTAEVKMLYNPTLQASWMFVPGIIALILTLISVMLTSVSIVREKEFGSMELLLVTPLKPITIIVGKVIPYFILSVFNISFIFLLGHLLFHVPVAGSIVTLYFISLLYIILALTIGIFISVSVSNQQIAMMISLVALMLPTILLSGFIFPIENMPKWLQVFSAIMPPRYFIEALRGIMLKGNGIVELWKDFAVIAGMMVVFIVLSIKKYKSRLM